MQFLTRVLDFFSIPISKKAIPFWTRTPTYTFVGAVYSPPSSITLISLVDNQSLDSITFFQSYSSSVGGSVFRMEIVWLRWFIGIFILIIKLSAGVFQYILYTSICEVVSFLSTGMATLIVFLVGTKPEFWSLIFDGIAEFVVWPSPTDTVTVLDDMNLDSSSHENGVWSYNVTFQEKIQSLVI